jgi:alkylhydroperoxidase family enzyme
MHEVHYPAERFPVRADLEASHRETWRRLAAPGTWWTGAERVAIAAEARSARRCALCAERKAAISPFAVEGRHESEGVLPPEVVDVVHRIVTDPGRLTRSWCRRVIDAGLDEPRYVELVAVIVKANALDVFARALGAELLPLPDPQPGEPTRRRPAEARDDGAWVSLVPAGPDGGAAAKELYGDREMVPNIGRALSLVPDEVHGLHVLSEPHYMALDHVTDPRYAEPGRALDRLQTELVAARVSAINECFY